MAFKFKLMLVVSGIATPFIIRVRERSKLEAMRVLVNQYRLGEDYPIESIGLSLSDKPLGSVEVLN